MKLQFHLLLTTALHNVNRDEDGRPKTATYGPATRGRISSQAKKRAIRFSPHYPDGQRAIRTREAGVRAYDGLRKAGVEDEKDCITAALAVNHALGGGGETPDDKAVSAFLKKNVTEKEILKRVAVTGEDAAIARQEVLRRALRSDQGLVVSSHERAALDRMVAELGTACREDRAGFPARLRAWVDSIGKSGLLDRDYADMDTALFGRMVAAKPTFNVDAACALSHAITTHAFAVEGDYFSAGEELNELHETGAAITSYAFFGAGVYYQHAVLDLDPLHETLGSDPERTRHAVTLFLEGLIHAQPGGKRNAFASDTAASYVLVSAGEGPTFNHMAAFLNPVRPSGNEDLLIESRRRLVDFHQGVAKAYGLTAESCLFNGYPPSWDEKPAVDEVRDLAALRAFVLSRLPAAVPA